MMINPFRVPSLRWLHADYYEDA